MPPPTMSREGQAIRNIGASPTWRSGYSSTLDASEASAGLTPLTPRRSMASLTPRAQASISLSPAGFQSPLRRGQTPAARSPVVHQPMEFSAVSTTHAYAREAHGAIPHPVYSSQIRQADVIKRRVYFGEKAYVSPIRRYAAVPQPAAASPTPAAREWSAGGARLGTPSPTGRHSPPPFEPQSPADRATKLAQEHAVVTKHAEAMSASLAMSTPGVDASVLAVDLSRVLTLRDRRKAAGVNGGASTYEYEVVWRARRDTVPAPGGHVHLISPTPSWLSGVALSKDDRCALLMQACDRRHMSFPGSAAPGAAAQVAVDSDDPYAYRQDAGLVSDAKLQADVDAMMATFHSPTPTAAAIYVSPEKATAGAGATSGLGLPPAMASKKLPTSPGEKSPLQKAETPADGEAAAADHVEEQQVDPVVAKAEARAERLRIAEETLAAVLSQKAFDRAPPGWIDQKGWTQAALGMPATVSDTTISYDGKTEAGLRSSALYADGTTTGQDDCMDRVSMAYARLGKAREENDAMLSSLAQSIGQTYVPTVATVYTPPPRKQPEPEPEEETEPEPEPEAAAAEEDAVLTVVTAAATEEEGQAAADEGAYSAYVAERKHTLAAQTKAVDAAVETLPTSEPQAMAAAPLPPAVAAAAAPLPAGLVAPAPALEEPAPEPEPQVEPEVAPAPEEPRARRERGRTKGAAGRRSRRQTASYDSVF